MTISSQFQKLCKFYNEIIIENWNRFAEKYINF